MDRNSFESKTINDFDQKNADEMISYPFDQKADFNSQKNDQNTISVEPKFITDGEKQQLTEQFNDLKPQSNPSKSRSRTTAEDCEKILKFPEYKFLKFDNHNNSNFQDGCQVLLIESVNLNNLNQIHWICNIFAYFDESFALIINWKANRLFLEVEKADIAKKIRIYMTDSDIFDSKMAISLTTATGISFPHESFVAGLAFYRPIKKFKSKVNNLIKFNYPSNFLHVTNIPTDMSVNHIYQLVSKIHEPLTIYRLHKAKNKSDMFLIEFESTTHSFEVLAVLNRKRIGEYSIKISFSHPNFR